MLSLCEYYDLCVGTIEIIANTLRDHVNCITRSWCGTDYDTWVDHQLPKIDRMYIDKKEFILQTGLT